jgi:transcriptional regulator with XRE-family HTH domain
MLSERLKEQRHKHKLTQQQVADKIGITRPAYTAYESGKRQPDYDLLKQLAGMFDVSVDYLIGKSDKPHYYTLTKKDYRDVDEMLEDALAGVTGKAGVNYFKNGSELSDEDRALLEASLRQTMILSKELAKKKFTPYSKRGSERPDK